MRETEKIEYCKNILRNNVFFDFEIDYYSGLSGKNPHGIEDAIWRKALRTVGKIAKKEK
jgi:hypothetical protein